MDSDGNNSGRQRYKFVNPPGIRLWALVFAKKLVWFGVIYVMVYSQVSLLWLVPFVIFEIVPNNFRGERVGAEHEVFLDREGNILPTWVTFPEVERPDVANEIINKLWPMISTHIFNYFSNTLETQFQQHVEGVSFNAVNVGVMPFRLGGIQAYDDSSPQKITLDVEVMYAGDFSMEFSWRRIKGQVSKLQLRGTLRLIMHPFTTSPPFVQSVECFFVTQPKLDFDLCTSFVSYPIPIFLVKPFIREYVEQQVGEMCVLPNSITIPVSG